MYYHLKKMTIHRYLKSDNVMIAPEGVLKVLSGRCHGDRGPRTGGW